MQRRMKMRTTSWCWPRVLASVVLGSLLGACATDTATPVNLGSSGLLTISAASLDGAVGAPYGNGAGVTFSVADGDPGALYYWTVSGSIPPGLIVAPATNSILSNTLIMVGTPLVAGTYSTQIAVHTTDHAPLIPPVQFDITITGGSGGPPVVPTDPAQFQGTWSGIIQGGLQAGKRLSLLIDSTAVSRQATAGTTVIATPSTPLTFVLDTTGAINSPIPSLSWHFVCRLQSGSLSCTGHLTSNGILDGTVTMTKVNAADQDTSAPSVGSSVPSSGATTIGIPQEVSVTFSEMLAAAPIPSFQLTGSAAATVTGVSFVDPNTAQTVSVQVTGLLVGTAYTLTLNPAGQTGLMDIAGNVLPTSTITFTTGTPIVNQPPSAIPASYNVVQSTSIPITLTGSDPEGGALTYQVVSSPAQGTLTGTAPSLTYTAPSAPGAYSFAFTVRDPAGNTSVPATISLTVIAPNQSPTAYPDTIGVPQNTATSFPLIGSDPEGSPFTFAIASGPLQGQVAVSGNMATYTPNSGYTGADQFTFTVRDSLGATSAAATVGITVVAGNQPPTASPQTFTFFKRQEITTINRTLYAVTLTGTDPEGGALTFRVTKFPAHGLGAGVVSGQSYWFVDPATGGFIDPVTGLPASDPVRVTSTSGISTSTVNLTTGTMTVSPAGSPYRFVYLPNICHDIFSQDTFEFVAIDAAGLRSPPAVVTMNSTTPLCVH